MKLQNGTFFWLWRYRATSVFLMIRHGTWIGLWDFLPDWMYCQKVEPFLLTPIVLVDFDLTISLLTHNLYRILMKNLDGFEQYNVPTIYRNFLENGALVKVAEDNVTVYLNKKTHLLILFALPWLKEKTKLSWLDVAIQFQSNTTL